MFPRSIVIAALFVIATFFASGFAAAGPTHRKHVMRIPASHVIVCDDRGCRDGGYAGRNAGAHVIGFSSDLVFRARGYIGKTAADLGLPRRLWCADFVNMLLGGGTGDRQAKSFLRYPRLPGPQVGAIAVLTRKGGGHAGVVSGTDPNGNPVLISGNHNKRVEESVYPKSRVVAYVRPP